MNESSQDRKQIKNRFRGFLPIVIDVETAGFNAKKDALLELAAVAVDYNTEGLLAPTEHFHYHIQPFEGANLDPKALEFTGIKPHHPFRFAVTEQKALEDLFKNVKILLKQTGCQRAILVGHNASFDLSFLLAAITRTELKHPFHSFTTLDTATLSALAFGETVLAKGLRRAGLGYDPEQAHSALYDATQTAKLFCEIVNRWGAWDVR